MLTILVEQFRPALTLLVLLTLLTGILYPAVVTGLAQVTMSHPANGSLMTKNGKTVGSELIGQPFSEAKYFWSRPSATSPQPYNAAASCGSNLGPTNPALMDAVKGRVEALRQADPDSRRVPPVDLVTASGSGLDPHISPASAEFQVHRIAQTRKLDEQVVRSLVAEFTEPRTFNLLGEPRVNVLKLNLALDDLKSP